MKPFLKWAGNKYQIINRIKTLLPTGNRLIEPFVGSGAVFLNTDYSDYLLADSNSDLIRLYQFLQKEGQTFIVYCKSFFTPENNSEKIYYEYRTLFNSTTDFRLKAALFVYLNKHCFNGLCRYNNRGEFNTPFGKYKKPYFPELEMYYFYKKTQKAIFKHADFKLTMNAAKIGDVIYCDPPYMPLSATANFTSYSPDGFGIKEQLELAHIAKQLANKGITVLISNHETEFTQEAYSDAKITVFDVQRYISCNGSNRNKISELLAVFS